MLKMEKLATLPLAWPVPVVRAEIVIANTRHVWRVFPGMLAHILGKCMVPETADSKPGNKLAKARIKKDAEKVVAWLPPSLQRQILIRAENLIECLFNLLPEPDTLLAYIATQWLFQELVNIDAFDFSEFPDLLAGWQYLGDAFVQGDDGKNISEWARLEDDGIASGMKWLEFLREKGFAK